MATVVITDSITPTSNAAEGKFQICVITFSANNIFRDVMCGMLHCKHLNERLEFGMESVAILSRTFLNSDGDIIACRSAILDFGLNSKDPGLVPDGAKCGDGKVNKLKKASFQNGIIYLLMYRCA
jgi:hypothetical protein